MQAWTRKRVDQCRLGDMNEFWPSEELEENVPEALAPIKCAGIPFQGAKQRDRHILYYVVSPTTRITFVSRIAKSSHGRSTIEQYYKKGYHLLGK